eukprot:105248_1
MALAPEVVNRMEFDMEPIDNAGDFWVRLRNIDKKWIWLGVGIFVVLGVLLAAFLHSGTQTGGFQCDLESNLCQNDGKCLNKKCYCLANFSGEKCENDEPLSDQSADQKCPVFDLEALSKGRRDCPNPNFYAKKFGSCADLGRQHICTLECADGATLLTKTVLQTPDLPMYTFATCGDKWSVPTVNPIGPVLLDPNTPACVPDWDK